jgi:hypothetical protein
MKVSSNKCGVLCGNEMLPYEISKISTASYLIKRKLDNDQKKKDKDEQNEE